MNRLFLFLILTIFSFIGVCQQTYKKFVNFQSTLRVNNIYPDGNTLWFANENEGVCQIDSNGVELQRFNKQNGLLSDSVKNFIIDKNNNKWFVYYKTGISKYDGKTWEHFNRTNGLVCDTITAIEVDSTGNVWCGTYKNQLSVYDGKSWSTYRDIPYNYQGDIITALACDIDGSMWICLESNFVVHYKDKVFNQVPLSVSYIPGILSIEIQKNGVKWFGTKGVGTIGYGALRLEGTTWTHFNQSTQFSTKKVNVSQIVSDDMGNVWFGTYNGGVSQFDGVSWTIHNTTDEIPSNIINAIAVDFRGKKWIATSYGFLSTYDNGTWVPNATLNMLSSSSISSIKIDSEGNKWMSGNGIEKFDGRNWTNYQEVSGYTSSFDIDKEGYIWASNSDQQVVRFNDTSSIVYDNIGLTSSYISSVAVDPNNVVWVGTRLGLTRHEGNQWIPFTEADQDVYHYEVNSIHSDMDGNVWVGSHDILKISSDTTIYYNIMWKYSNPLRVYDFAIDTKGDVWLCSEYGLYTLRDTTWIRYSTLQGLPSNFIYSIEIDNENNKWLGTAYGLVKFDGLNVTIFDKNDGLVDNSVIDIAIDAYGNKWLGTGNGVSVFNEDGVNLSNFPPMRLKSDTSLTIKGLVYLDIDSNGVYNSSDMLLANQKIMLQPNKTVTYTNSQGEFSFRGITGNSYTIESFCQTPFSHGLSPQSYTITKLVGDTVIPPFGLWARDTMLISSHLSTNALRCGSSAQVMYTFKNEGTRIANYTVVLSQDNTIKSTNSIPKADSVGADGRLFWNFNKMMVNQEQQIRLVIDLPIGMDTMLFSACIYHDGKKLKDDKIYEPLRCSFDPNDKQVLPTGIGSQRNVLKDEELTYTIRFQNTGNDYAYDIKIIDTLSTSFDLSSFKVISSSHKMRTELLENGIAYFYFDNIWLPDSGRNYIESNGYVTFAIKALQPVSEGTIVKNTSYIYFDKNEPVVTNTTINTLVSELQCTSVSIQDTTYAFKKYNVLNKEYSQVGTFTFPKGNSLGCIDFTTRTYLFTDIAGDVNGNSIIDDNEVAGDCNANGIIDEGEIFGDINGNGIIDANEQTPLSTSGTKCNINVAPVPVTNILSIYSGKECQPVKVEIFDSKGSKVLCDESRSNTINVMSLHSGIYVVIVFTENEIISKQIVKY